MKKEIILNFIGNLFKLYNPPTLFPGMILSKLLHLPYHLTMSIINCLRRSEFSNLAWPISWLSPLHNKDNDKMRYKILIPINE